MNRSARAAGVHPGQTLAAARACAALLESVLEDPSRTAEARRAVVRDLLPLSPRICVDGPHRFWLDPSADDTTLPGWCAAVREALRSRGRVSLGVAPNATLAHAAACTVPDASRVVTSAEARAFLDDAPLEVLELHQEALDILAALGIRRVVQLRALPPRSLGERFGPAVAEARRRADGWDPRAPITPRLEAPHEVRVALDDELDTLPPLLFLLAPAAARLMHHLSSRGLGTLTLALTLELRGGARQRVALRTGAPLSDARTCLELLRTHLEHERVSAPVVAFVLEAVAVSDAPSRSRRLFDGPGRDPAARQVALDRLRTRFGDGCIVRARRTEVGPTLDRARFDDSEELSGGSGGPALPWRRLETPARVEQGRVRIGGRLRRVERIGSVERVTPPWWEDGRKRVELLAWAELSGPMLALLRARCDTRCEDTWEVVAWVD